MVVEGYNHHGYHVFPAYRQLTNADGTGGAFYPSASVMRWRGDDGPLSVPYDWPDTHFKSAEEAVAYAKQAAHALIEQGKIPF